jgi:pimeloyl-ACP methyl ester carboxylesterase
MVNREQGDATRTAVPAAAFGGQVMVMPWQWEGQSLRVVYEVLGQGEPILLLPAFSSVSSRLEMAGLAQQLAARYQVYVLDWVGFGQSDRPAIDYTPKVYRALLRDFVQQIFGRPVVVMAAGHTAGYVMQLAQEQTQHWQWIVLLAPTWRGPLPTMLARMSVQDQTKRGWFKVVQRLVNLPIVGQLLYWANTTQGFLGWMYGRHVFVDRQRITRSLLAVKQGLSRQENGRFAVAAFVTGALDPLRDREAWLRLFQPIGMPVLLVIGEQMPPKSRAEAEVVAHFGGAVQVLRMPGTLGLAEEYPTELCARVEPFLAKYLTR